ncbi:MAG: YecA family protein [Gammaproteobacteria bacterium]|jgi:uncharacterized protein|nr:YecA family protein [Gammaproteobacteria bacterium]MBQ0773511.1 YecA family protein [Gammaproteobacteria bacterium]
MTQPDNPDLRQHVIDYLKHNGEDALSWVETHGLLCALACGPLAEDGWQAVIQEEQTVPSSIADALSALRDRLHAQLGIGEAIQPPCRLDPYEENDGDDLTSWCAGFVTGVSLNEAAWHDEQGELVFELLLPFLLISGLDEDPEMDTLWQDTDLVKQMAAGIPDLLEELFLLYHAPELSVAAQGGDDDGDDDQE